MYPILEAYRESDGKSRGNSFFEQNCSQIFTKGPALTKEILEKVNSEIVPKKTYIFGRELKTKRILLIAGLSLLFSVSLFGTILMWCTRSFDNFVLSQLVLEKDSDAFKLWLKPPVRAHFKVYIFNYTNVNDYREQFVDKLHVQELGPYTYEQILEKVNISFPTDDTISFREKRTLNFLPELSTGSETDLLMVPNLPVITGSAATKRQNYFTQLGFNGLLSGLNEDAFLKIQAGPFLTGYKDQLFELVKRFLPEGTPDKIGILVPKMGESPIKFTINTGKRDINKLAMVEKVDDKTEFDYYSEKTCNSIQGTDGALYPPKLVQNKKPLYYVFPEGCRRMPLVFEKETTVLDGKVPAYQYVMPEDIFDSVEVKPENECYCNRDNGQCSLKGVFNVTSCNYGVPMFISHPHFHRADPRLLKPFTGLKPNGRDYKSYFKLHPTMGFAMSVKNSLQVNIQVQKAASVDKVDMFDDGMILPIAWLEGVLEDKQLPQEVVDTIYLVSFTVPSIKLALSFGSLLTAIITLASLILVLRRKSTKVQTVYPERLISTQQGYYIAS